MRTTLYGAIEEMDFWKDPIRQQVRRYNTSVIHTLPVTDKWPPLSRGMFSICENDNREEGPNLEYFARVIHFGANLKSVELDWMEWRTKFETLLTKLFFLKAYVHFKTEYSALQTFSWNVDLLKYKVLHDGKMPAAIKQHDWTYESDYDDVEK